MSKYLAILCLLLCSCSDYSSKHDKKQKLKDMHETFRILNSQNVNSYLQINLWRNFLIAFAEDIENEEQDNQIRGRVKRRITLLQEKIKRIHSSQATQLVQQNNRNDDTKNTWIKKVNAQHRFSYKVKKQWHETHSQNTQNQQTYTYHLDRNNIIVFNVFYDGEPLGIHQVVLAAELNMFKEYSDYLPIAHHNVQINNNLGKYLQYQLTSREGHRYLAIALYFVENSKVYISYAVFPRSSPYIAALKEALYSLHIEKAPVIPHGKKWITVDYPQQNFTYKIPSSWKLQVATNTPTQHVNYCIPNSMVGMYIFTSKLNSNYRWEQNLGVLLKWLEPYEIISHKKYDLNGMGAQKNFYRSHSKVHVLTPQFVELIYGKNNGSGFLVYSVYPGKLAKIEVQKIRTVMNSLKLNTIKKQESLFSTVREESFPISYQVPKHYKCYTEENSLHTIYRVYEGQDAQFSFYISRQDTSVDDLIQKIEQSLQSFPGKLTEKIQKQVVWGNILGKNKTYVHEGFDSRQRHLSYFFAKNPHFTCVFGFWSRKAHNQDHRQIRQSLNFCVDKNAQRQY